MVLFETERLSLEEIELIDQAFIFELMNSPGWLKNIGDRGIKTPLDAQKYIRDSFRKQYSQPGLGLYKIVLKTINIPLGICGLLMRSYLDQEDIGFALLPEFEGKGFAFEAAGATLQHASRNGILHFSAIVTPTNEPSIKLLKRLGFHFKKNIQPNEELLSLYQT